MKPPVIETDRLRLRGLTADDFKPLVEFWSQDRTKHRGGPYNASTAWRILATEIGHWSLRGYGRFAIDELSTGTLCGVVGPWFPYGYPGPEIGWDLMPGFEGRGYATEAAKAARAYAYNTIGWPGAVSLIHPFNESSIAVAERLGAKSVGQIQQPGYGPLMVYRHPGPEALT